MAGLIDRIRRSLRQFMWTWKCPHDPKKPWTCVCEFDVDVEQQERPKAVWSNFISVPVDGPIPPMDIRKNLSEDDWNKDQPDGPIQSFVSESGRIMRDIMTADDWHKYTGIDPHKEPVSQEENTNFLSRIEDRVEDSMLRNQ